MATCGRFIKSFNVILLMIIILNYAFMSAFSIKFMSVYVGSKALSNNYNKKDNTVNVHESYVNTTIISMFPNLFIYSVSILWVIFICCCLCIDINKEQIQQNSQNRGFPYTTDVRYNRNDEGEDENRGNELNDLNVVNSYAYEDTYEDEELNEKNNDKVNEKNIDTIDNQKEPKLNQNSTSFNQAQAITMNNPHLKCVNCWYKTTITIAVINYIFLSILSFVFYSKFFDHEIEKTYNKNKSTYRIHLSYVYLGIYSAIPSIVIYILFALFGCYAISHSFCYSS